MLQPAQSLDAIQSNPFRVWALKALRIPIVAYAHEYMQIYMYRYVHIWHTHTQYIYVHCLSVRQTMLYLFWGVCIYEPLRTPRRPSLLYNSLSCACFHSQHASTQHLGLRGAALYFRMCTYPHIRILCTTQTWVCDTNLESYIYRYIFVYMYTKYTHMYVYIYREHAQVCLYICIQVCLYANTQISR